jgi:hypothetical protein
MDMKRILQALDGASTKPVEGANDMKKFMSIISEGANPHKVSLPVQMAMQHYQEEPKTVVTKPATPSLLKKYFAEAEAEVEAEKAVKKARLNQYANKIAERVLMKESVIAEKSTTEKQARTMAAAAHNPAFAKKVGIKTSVAKEFNKADTGTKQLSNAMKHKDLNENQLEAAPRDPRTIQQEIKQEEKSATKVEYTLGKVREITKEIKYNDTPGDIVLRVRALAQTVPNIDQHDLRSSEEAVFEKVRELESAIYSLEEAFEYAARHARNKVEDLESELDELNWNSKYGRAEEE